MFSKRVWVPAVGVIGHSNLWFTTRQELQTDDLLSF